MLCSFKTLDLDATQESSLIKMQKKGMSEMVKCAMLMKECVGKMFITKYDNSRDTAVD